MGVRSWLHGMLAPKDQGNLKAANEVTSLTLDELIKRLNARLWSTDSGTTVNVMTAEGQATVAAVERLLSGHIASLPLVLFARDGQRREPARDNPWFVVFHDRPNSWQSSYQWRRIIARDIFYRGNGYNVVAGNELIRLHPDHTAVKQDERTLEVHFEYAHPAGGKQRFERDEVLHIWEQSDDGLVGINPIRAYRQTIGDAIAIRMHGSKFFSNAARVSGVLELEAGTKISDPSAKALVDDFDSTYGGNENAHKTAVLPGGVQFKPITMNMDDAQWLEARKLTMRELCGIFGVAPHKLGDLERATFNSVEQLNIDFVVDALTPRLVAWEQAFNKDVLNNDPDLFVKFNVAGLLRGTFLTRQQGLQVQRQNGIINANEWREKEDLNRRDDDGGDIYIVQKNMAENSRENAEVDDDFTKPN